MHEYGVTKSLVDLCNREADKNNLKAISKIKLRVGKFTGFSPDSIEFYFEHLKADTKCSNARIEFENGCTANITASRVSPKKVRQLRIFQGNGSLTIDFLNQTIRVLRKDQNSDRPQIVSEEVRIETTDALEREIHSFIQKVKDRTVPLVSGKNGKMALEVALAITEQIEKKMVGRRDLSSLDV